MYSMSAPIVASATGKNLNDIYSFLGALEPARANHPRFNDRNPYIGLLATVATECSFKPINEIGGPAYFAKTYWDDVKVRKMLGNTTREAAILYHGRGYVQLTGEDNYIKAGRALGIDLHGHPELALDPAVAAKVLLWFSETHGLDVHSTRGNWKRVRQLVNGGSNGWDTFAGFHGHVYALIEASYS